ncbi:MAG TPA: hypothetical protein VFY91_06850 [Microbacterium sp.]|nr:hypothetical protein [Microbacterium sp.]
MHTIDLIIGEYVHRLPMSTDEVALLAELTDAVHAGGGIVDLATHSAQSSVAVLISPGVPVFIERTVLPDDSFEDVITAGGVDLPGWPDLE